MQDRPARGWGLVAGLAVVVAVADALRYSGYLIDDTFISFRYARNLLDGNGLVFNVGERVEGYTNFLFVVLAAVAMRLHLDPVLATKALSVAAAAVSLGCTAWMERRGPALWAAQPGEHRWSRLVSPSVVLLLPLQAFAYWAVASFETMLFTALLTAALALLMREGIAAHGHASVALFAALALTRPEGIFLFGAATAAFALAEWRSGRPNLAARHSMNAALFVGAVAPYVLWRWWYYGRLLPNTFYAKVTGDTAQLASGLRHAADWILEYPLPAAALLLPAALVSPRLRTLSARYPYCVAIYLVALAHAAYVVLVGGDFMPFFRFFVPILPLCCLLLAWSLGALAAIGPGGARFAHAAIAGAVLVNFAASHLSEQPYRAFVAHRTAVVGERVGAWLRAKRRPDDVIALNTAGAVPYASGLSTIDMLGLTDAQIAQRPVYIASTGWAGHRKGWGDYVLARRPAAILWYNSAGAREPFYLSDHELADNPFFRFFYRLRVQALPDTSDRNAQPIARFLGAPFGAAADGSTSSFDLGITATVLGSPVQHTVLAEGPMAVTYFEPDGRDTPLWPLAARSGSDVAAFVDAVASSWSRTAKPPPLPGPALDAIHVTCESARRAIAAGRYAEARALLSQAADANVTVRSPLVYQYIANLAVVTGDLFAATVAQKEALRLRPDSALYRNNLVQLLTVPYREGTLPRPALAAPADGL